MRITKKMIAEQEARDALLRKNTNTCIAMITQKLDIGIANDGGMILHGDDQEWESPMKYAGKRVKSTMVNIPIDPATEMAFDPYNNIKLMISLLNMYIEIYEDSDILTLSLSTKKLNEYGFAELKFEDGRVVRGNEYFRDSLKYMDIIYALDGSAPPEFKRIKELDME